MCIPEKDSMGCGNVISAGISSVGNVRLSTTGGIDLIVSRVQVKGVAPINIFVSWIASNDQSVKRERLLRLSPDICSKDSSGQVVTKSQTMNNLSEPI